MASQPEVAPSHSFGTPGSASFPPSAEAAAGASQAGYPAGIPEGAHPTQGFGVGAPVEGVPSLGAPPAEASQGAPQSAPFGTEEPSSFGQSPAVSPGREMSFPQASQTEVASSPQAAPSDSGTEAASSFDSPKPEFAPAKEAPSAGSDSIENDFSNLFASREEFPAAGADRGFAESMGNAFGTTTSDAGDANSEFLGTPAEGAGESQSPANHAAFAESLTGGSAAASQAAPASASESGSDELWGIQEGGGTSAKESQPSRAKSKKPPRDQVDRRIFTPMVKSVLVLGVLVVGGIYLLQSMGGIEGIKERFGSQTPDPAPTPGPMPGPAGPVSPGLVTGALPADSAVQSGISSPPAGGGQIPSDALPGKGPGDRPTSLDAVPGGGEDFGDPDATQILGLDHSTTRTLDSFPKVPPVPNPLPGEPAREDMDPHVAPPVSPAVTLPGGTTPGELLPEDPAPEPAPAVGGDEVAPLPENEGANLVRSNGEPGVGSEQRMPGSSPMSETPPQTAALPPPVEGEDGSPGMREGTPSPGVGQDPEREPDVLGSPADPQPLPAPGREPEEGTDEKGPDSPPQDPGDRMASILEPVGREVIEAFYGTKAIDERSEFVIEPDLYQPEMEAYYRRFQELPTLEGVEFRGPMRDAASGRWFGVFDVQEKENQSTHRWCLVQVRPGEMKLDWNIYQQLIDQSLDRFLDDPEAEPKDFRLVIRRGIEAPSDQNPWSDRTWELHIQPPLDMKGPRVIVIPESKYQELGLDKALVGGNARIGRVEMSWVASEVEPLVKIPTVTKVLGWGAW